MIFAATHQQVLRGAKTQTRRLLRPYPRRLPARPAPRIGGQQPAPPKWPGKHHHDGQAWRACPVTVGRSYAVQPGRGQHALARIQVTDTRVEPLGHITPADAQREGFRTTTAFKRTWIHLHDAGWLDQAEALLDFTLPVGDEQLAALDPGEARVIRRQLADLEQAGSVEHTGGGWLPLSNALDQAILHRFNTRWAHKPVWVITFQLEHDTVRWLRAGMGREGSDRDTGDYTRSPGDALDQDAPPVDDAVLAQYAARASFVSEQRRAAQLAETQAAREVLELHERLRALETRPAGADVTRELRLIRRRIEQAEKRAARGPSAQVAVRRDAV